MRHRLVPFSQSTTVRESPQIARRCFLAALDQDPHFVVAELGLGAVCLAEGDFRGSFSAYKSALRKLGDLAPNIVRVVMGVCSFKLREFEHATKCIDRALEVDPKDAMALLMRFMMQTQTTQMQQQQREGGRGPKCLQSLLDGPDRQAVRAAVAARRRCQRW